MLYILTNYSILLDFSRDSRGTLIGMNTAIYSPTGASAGIGFAIPIDTIKYM